MLAVLGSRVAGARGFGVLESAKPGACRKKDSWPALLNRAIAPSPIVRPPGNTVADDFRFAPRGGVANLPP